MYRDEQGQLTTTHVIRTPELVEFEFELAGLVSRLLAWLIDALLIAVLVSAVLLALSLVMVLSSGLGGFLIPIALFLINWGYFSVLEWRTGGLTVGKRALGLRVLQVTGTRIGFSQAVLRNLLRAFDHLPLLYAVGGASALLAPSRRRLGDLVAGTMVVRERRKALPARLAAGQVGPARPGATARLEERMRRASVAERDLLLSAVLRREELEMSARLTLFTQLARFVEERFGVEKPDHYSDEKLVVEAVACLLRVEGLAPTALPRPRPLPRPL